MCIVGLKALLNDPFSEIRCSAALAIMDLLQQKGIPFLLPLLRDKNDIVRWAITGMLYDWGDSILLPFFEKMAVTDHAPDVRVIAISAIGKYGNGSSIPLLQTIEQMDKGETFMGHTVQYTAKESIEEIQKRNSQI